MDKKILEDYIDACEFIKETEAEIRKLEKKKKYVQDKVRGSNPEFPYQPQSFGIAGTTNTYANEDLIKSNEHILEVQRKEAQELKIQVEAWMKKIPFRMRRIIKHKVFEGKSWGEVASLMGRKCTKESVRKEFESFMKSI